MPRKQVYETIPISIKLTKEQIQRLRKRAWRDSFKQSKTITLSSLVRHAIEKVYSEEKNAKKTN